MDAQHREVRAVFYRSVCECFCIKSMVSALFFILCPEQNVSEHAHLNANKIKTT